MANQQWFKDNQGRIIGRRDDYGDRVAYSDHQGRLVATFFPSGNYTITNEGHLIGKGDLGMLQLGNR